MRHLVVLLVLAVSLAACSDLPIAPVNHACVGNPAKSQGSGCNDSHRD
jgi:hypothetical protein